MPRHKEEVFDMTGKPVVYAEEVSGIVFFTLSIFLTEQATFSILAGIFGVGYVMLLNKYFRSGVKE